MVSLQAISHLQIASLVPSTGRISFDDISERTGLNKQIVQRLLRHAATMRIFREPEPGMIAHTKASKILASPHINDWMKVATADVWPTAIKVQISTAKEFGNLVEGG
jgi:hypothetical protein